MKNRIIPLSRLTCLLLSLFLLTASALCFAGCKDDAPAEALDMSEVRKEINSRKTADFEESDSQTEYVRITVKGHGDIVLRLRADVAPETVRNFQKLVAGKHYDGLIFHRVISYFMIQGGDPLGNGTGSTTPIKGEMTNNGFENKLEHIRGVLSMARRSGDYNSGSCQFFICCENSDYLNGEYASFGYVVAGLETVDSIRNVQTNPVNDRPLEDVVMEKVCFVKLK